MKNGKLKRIMASCLSLLTLSMVAFTAGCRKGDDSNGSDVSLNKPVDGGLHQDTQKETEDKLVANGKTDYKIVMPTNATKNEDIAVSELVGFFHEATGIVLPRVNDSQVMFDENSKYIVIGETTLNDTANVKADVNEVKTRGYIIKTVGKSIFIVGGKDDGTVNGVYGFLEKVFDYDYFASKCYTIQKGVKNVALYDFDVKEAPDINHVTLDTMYSHAGDALWRTRLKTSYATMYALWIGSHVAHNTVQGFLPVGTYLNQDDPENYHPEWYSNSYGNQVCWTAHGDPESRELLMKTVLDRVTLELTRQPNAEYLLYGIEDNTGVCGCTACKAKLDVYGQPSGLYIEFVNELKARVDAWFEGEGKEYYRPFQIHFFAYLDWDVPPVKYDEKGENPQVTIKCAEGVVPYTAYIRHDYQYAIYDPKVKFTYDRIKAWNMVADEVAFYYYDTNFVHPLAGYNTFESLQSNYQIAFESGANWLLNQSMTQLSNRTGWSNLKNYWQGKLGWNVNSDMNYYTEKFFENYFGPAATSMKKWFMEWRAHTIYMRDELGHNMFNPKNKDDFIGGVLDSSLYIKTPKAEYWSINLLDRWWGYADEALKAIESLKITSPEKYDFYYKAIILERVSLGYLLVESFGSALGERELPLKLQFKEDAALSDVGFVMEGVPISTLYAKWKI